jgi:CspA family cold shock protein
MSKREIGKVKWFDAKKGYGFISRKDADDVFVHYTAIQGKGYRVLKDDQEVEFTIVQGKKGLEARNLVLVNEQEQENKIENETENV